MRMVTVFIAIMGSLLVQGCSPEVGSEAWCEKMGKTPEAEWSPNDASNFMTHCNLGDLFGK